MDLKAKYDQIYPIPYRCWLGQKHPSWVSTVYHEYPSNLPAKLQVEFWKVFVTTPTFNCTPLDVFEKNI